MNDSILFRPNTFFFLIGIEGTVEGGNAKRARVAARKV
jgi:hypothetical protein